MELVTDDLGHSAPSLGEVELSPEQARSYHAFLVQQVQLMLCAGLIHGDLSEYNVLVGKTGPVIIDLPQVVNAANNNSARDMLLRDLNNLTTTLSRFAPELQYTRYGEELWQLYARGQLHPTTVLKGDWIADESSVNIDEVRLLIDHAEEEALRRQRGREAAERDPNDPPEG